MGTVLLRLLVELSHLRKVDGLVTLEDDVNLRRASFLAREVLGMEAKGATGCS